MSQLEFEARRVERREGKGLEKGPRVQEYLRKLRQNTKAAAKSPCDTAYDLCLFSIICTS